MADEIIMSENNDNGFISTIDVTSKRGRLAFVNATSNSTSLADFGEKKFTVKDILLSRGVRSQTGEICTNTYLILDDDSAVMSQSDGVARAAMAIIQSWNGNLGNGLVCEVTTKKLSNGRTLKSLHVIDEVE